MYLKKLNEKKADLAAQMAALIETGETENRALTAEEQQAFDAMEAEVRGIDATIERIQRSRPAPQQPSAGGEDTAAAEERAFANYIRGTAMELRSGEQNVDIAGSSAIIPTSIANRIIQAVKDRCPILAGCDLYHVKGKLKIPVWGNANSTHNIAVGYAADFNELVADAGKFTSADLDGYLAGALALVGRQLVNNSDVDVVQFVVDYMAEEIAIWAEGELLTGTGHSNNHCEGACSTTNTIPAGSTSEITGDNLIDLQARVKQAYQKDACWTMHPNTWTVVKKLKDGNGRYLVQDDFTGDMPFRLLGKPVYLSDNMAQIASGAKAVLYGDYKGLSAKIGEELNVQVLREKYATQHAVGVVGWLEIDSVVSNPQKLATLTMSVS